MPASRRGLVLADLELKNCSYLVVSSSLLGLVSALAETAAAGYHNTQINATAAVVDLSIWLFRLVSASTGNAVAAAAAAAGGGGLTRLGRDLSRERKEGPARRAAGSGNLSKKKKVRASMVCVCV